MRLLVQRVAQARVAVDGRTVAAIGPGLLVLAGFSAQDPPDLPQTGKWTALLNKVLDLRVFPDQAGRLNLSLRDVDGEILAVSQFTLYADCGKGRRPSFHLAAGGELALCLYRALVRDLERLHPGRTAQGVFGADMDVCLVNRGPVTILLDSDDL